MVNVNDLYICTVSKLMKTTLKFEVKVPTQKANLFSLQPKILIFKVESLSFDSSPLPKQTSTEAQLLLLLLRSFTNSFSSSSKQTEATCCPKTNIYSSFQHKTRQVLQHCVLLLETFVVVKADRINLLVVSPQRKVKKVCVVDLQIGHVFYVVFQVSEKSISNWKT